MFLTSLETASTGNFQALSTPSQICLLVTCLVILGSPGLSLKGGRSTPPTHRKFAQLLSDFNKGFRCVRSGFSARTVPVVYATYSYLSEAIPIPDSPAYVPSYFIIGNCNLQPCPRISGIAIVYPSRDPLHQCIVVHYMISIKCNRYCCCKQCVCCLRAFRDKITRISSNSGVYT